MRGPDARAAAERLVHAAGQEYRHSGAAACDLPENLTGTVVHDRYEIAELIGKGGSGCVFRVLDLRVRTEWAMKVVQRTEKGVYMAKAAAEADVLRRLRHPNLPRIVDVFEDDTSVYIVMDYLEGITLRDLIRMRGAFDQDEVIRIGIALTDVLIYLHGFAAPIIYRDMKPGNIMMKKNGDIVLFDFGIAREFKGMARSDTIPLGTIGYAAPEQYGEGQSDERTDIYGLGATLFHLATGADPAEPPYGIRPIRSIRPSLSAGFEKVIETAVRADPEKRYQNAAEMRRALLHCREMDDSFLKSEIRRYRLFLFAAVMSAAAFLGTIVGGAKVLEMRNRNYSCKMTEAGTLAAESLLKGEFDAAVMDAFSEAIDLMPEREEGYL